ncbi:SURF1 family protein [soil metagenome]
MRFALRPWWIVSHLIVAALVVTMMSLGFWQLRRLDEVKDRNAELAVRLADPEVAVAALVPPDEGAVDGAAVEDRRVTVTGRYRADQQVLIRGRSLNDAPGSWVLASMELDDGRVVAVNRGWIRNDGRYTAVPDDYATPEGEVTVVGITHPTQERGTLGATDPANDTLTSLSRVDLDPLDTQFDGDPPPIGGQVTDPEPGAADPAPEPLDPPVVDDEGPHLSYAAQWFIFATIALVGYPLILRKVARERSGRGPDDAPGLDDPDPDDRPAPGDPRLDAPAEP